MEFEKVKEIFETKSVWDCNNYLKNGWVLLAVAAMNTDSSEYSKPIFRYSLGWIKDSAPQHFYTHDED